MEVTAAADAASIELWKLVNHRDERWVDGRLLGGWAVSLAPTARAKRVLTELPALLAGLEAAGMAEFGRDWRAPADPWVDALLDLGVVSGSRGDTDYPGVIYPTIELPTERAGGGVSATGRPLSDWVGQFLAEPQQMDVVHKLGRSGADERHAFIILPGFTTAPFPVADLLWRADGPLPDAVPQFPNEVTHVWVVTTWAAGRGLRWSPGEGWRQFRSDVLVR